VFFKKVLPVPLECFFKEFRQKVYLFQIEGVNQPTSKDVSADQQ